MRSAWSITERDRSRERVERRGRRAPLGDREQIDARDEAGICGWRAARIAILEPNARRRERSAHRLHDVAGRGARGETVEIAQIPAGIGGAIELVARTSHDADDRAGLDRAIERGAQR